MRCYGERSYDFLRTLVDVEHLLGTHGVPCIVGDMVDGDLDDVLGEEQQRFCSLDKHRQQRLHLHLIVMTLADLTTNRLRKELSNALRQIHTDC